MITKSQRKSLKKILGKAYTVAVLDILNSEGKLNSQGNPHNTIYVSRVFSGKRENADVEAAIWELAKRKQDEAALAKKMKREILN